MYCCLTAMLLPIWRRDEGPWTAYQQKSPRKADKGGRRRVIHIAVSSKEVAAYIQPCGQPDRRQMCGTVSPKSHLTSNSPRSRSIRIYDFVTKLTCHPPHELDQFLLAERSFDFVITVEQSTDSDRINRLRQVALRQHKMSGADVKTRGSHCYS